MQKKHVILLALLLPCVASAADVSRLFTCDMGAVEFFKPLVQRRLIDLNAYKNEDSISYFRLIKMKPGMNKVAEATAFGMQVTGVIGYVSDQMLFRRGPGTEPMNTYGFVVTGDVEKVKAGLSAMGANKAVATQAEKNTTEIYCEESSR